MSITTAFVHEVFEGIRHRLHRYDDPPARTVPAAVDWPEWHHYQPHSNND